MIKKPALAGFLNFENILAFLSTIEYTPRVESNYDISLLWEISENLTDPQDDAMMNVSAKNHLDVQVLAENRISNDRVVEIPDEWSSSPRPAQNAESLAKSRSGQRANDRSIAATVLAEIKMAGRNSKIVLRRIFARAKRVPWLLSGLKSKISGSMASERNSRS